MGDKPEFKVYGTGYTTPMLDVAWCKYAKALFPDVSTPSPTGHQDEDPDDQEHAEVASLTCQFLRTGSCVLADIAVREHFSVPIKQDEVPMLELNRKQDALRASLGLDQA